jgi:hypothetical protein
MPNARMSAASSFSPRDASYLNSYLQIKQRLFKAGSFKSFLPWTLYYLPDPRSCLVSLGTAQAQALVLVQASLSSLC